MITLVRYEDCLDKPMAPNIYIAQQYKYTGLLENWTSATYSRKENYEKLNFHRVRSRSNTLLGYKTILFL